MLAPDAPLPATSERPLARCARAGAHVALYLATLAGTLALLGRAAPPGGGDLLGSKLQHYLASVAQHDTVFLGSSHVYRAFVPAVFDAELAAAGVEARSFNLGVQSTHQLELEYLARLVLDEGRGHLARLFVEYQPFAPQLDLDNAFQARTVHWHDAEATALALARTHAAAAATPGGIPLVVSEDEHSILGLAERCLPSWWRIDRVHLQHFAKRELCVARGPDLVENLRGRARGGEWRANRGYLSLEEDERRAGARAGTNPYRRRREAFLADLADYTAELAALEREPVFFGDGEWMDARLLQVPDFTAYRRMAAEARAAGVELVIVVMPAGTCDRAAEERLARELGVRVLRFNRPARFPALYEPELRFDSGHLAEAGARVFSVELARAWLAGSGGGP